MNIVVVHNGKHSVGVNIMVAYHVCCSAPNCGLFIFPHRTQISRICNSRKTNKKTEYQNDGHCHGLIVMVFHICILQFTIVTPRINESQRTAKQFDDRVKCKKNKYNFIYVHELHT